MISDSAGKNSQVPSESGLIPAFLECESDSTDCENQDAFHETDTDFEPSVDQKTDTKLHSFTDINHFFDKV